MHILRIKDYVILAAFALFSAAVFADSEDVFYRAQDQSVQHGIYFSEKGRIPDAAVIFVHGMQSHAEWVRGSGYGDELAENGIDVFAFDRRGSGKSMSRRGDASSADVLIQDMEDAVSYLEQRLFKLYGEASNKIEIHIIANCFGARIVVPYLAQTPEMNQRFASLTLIAPSTHMTKQASYSFMEKLGILVSRKDRYVDTPLEDEWFVSEGEGLEWIQNDKDGLREVTVGFLKEVKKLTKIMNQHIHDLPIPMLIMVGERDVMVHSDLVKTELFDTHRFAKRFVSLDSEHSLEFGDASEQFLDASVDWISGSGVKLRNQFVPKAIPVPEPKARKRRLGPPHRRR